MEAQEYLEWILRERYGPWDFEVAVREGKLYVSLPRSDCHVSYILGPIERPRHAERAALRAGRLLANNYLELSYLEQGGGRV